MVRVQNRDASRRGATSSRDVAEVTAGVLQVEQSLIRWVFIWGLLLCGLGCHEQPYPSRPITIIVPWAAGGGTDRLARFLADALQRELNVPCVVANRTGGAGAIGHQAGASARPDGYTLTVITFELCTMHHMGISKLTFRDFESLMQWNADPAAVIVRQDARWQDLRELLDEARKEPGKLKMSGTARGGAWDLARAGLLLANGQSVDDIVWVPTLGAAPALVELLGGHVDAVCCSIPEAASVADQVRVLAVMSDERLATYPQVPTCRELGIDWTAVGWRGLAAPRGLPLEVREVLLEACRRISHSDEFREFMTRNGFQIAIREADSFERFLADQDRTWHETIRAAGFQQ